MFILLVITNTIIIDITNFIKINMFVIIIIELVR
jgi:hypothetical protein